MNHVRYLKTLDACDEAVDFAARYKSLTAAWKACNRGDWMLWLASKTSGPRDSASRKKVVHAACLCAKTALKYVPKGELRPKKAIDTALKYVHGESSLDEVQAAASASYSADDAAHAAYAAAHAAAYATGYVVYVADAAHAAADDAAYAAASASYTTGYVADAAYAYAGEMARARAIKRCANIVRKVYPNPPKRAKRTTPKGEAVMEELKK